MSRKVTKRAKKAAAISPVEMRALRDQCDSFISGHGPRPPAQTLEEMGSLGPDELAADIYGQGGSVAVLENEVREQLDMPAAVFMPSGTMIQQAALRIHADRRNSRVVAFHPTCHLELHEDKAYQRLHGLIGRPVGSRQSLMTVEDLEDIHEPLAALLLELPQREIGGQLPVWDDLVAQVEWARAHGAAAHLDGARLWECGPFYGRPLADIAALFDTVYVSFYKGLGGVAGGMLLGPEDVIAEAREWRHRHGGTLFNLWPYAAAALAGLRLRLPRMQAAFDHAQAIAAELRQIDRVTVVPDPPQVPMMHLLLKTTEADFVTGVRRLVTDEHLWTWGGSYDADAPGHRWVELYVGDGPLALSPQQIATAVRALLPS